MLPRRRTYVYWFMGCTRSVCRAVFQGHESNKIIKGGVLLFSDDAMQQPEGQINNAPHRARMPRANYSLQYHSAGASCNMCAVRAASLSNQCSCNQFTENANALRKLRWRYLMQFAANVISSLGGVVIYLQSSLAF